VTIFLRNFGMFFFCTQSLYETATCTMGSHFPEITCIKISKYITTYIKIILVMYDTESMKINSTNLSQLLCIITVPYFFICYMAFYHCFASGNRNQAPVCVWLAFNNKNSSPSPLTGQVSVYVIQTRRKGQCTLPSQWFRAPAILYGIKWTF
jgi:hypothetical protein